MHDSKYTLWMLTALLLLLLTITQAASGSCPETGPVAPAQHNLTNVHTAFLDLSQHNWGSPIGITYANQIGVAFAALSVYFEDGPTSLLVLDTSTLKPKVIQDIHLPKTEAGQEGTNGVTVSNNGKFAYAVAGHGAFVIDTKKAAKESSDPIIGFLNSENKKKKPGDSAFDVVISKDDDYLFVFQEYGPHGSKSVHPGNVDVFKLDTSTGLGPAIGFLPLGLAVTAGVFSPNGEYMYVTSEAGAESSSGNKVTFSPGIVSVIDVKKLEEDPKKALLGNVKVGYSAVRAVVSSDGKTLWVANRESNSVWALDTDKMLSDADNAHIATVDVGTAPVGLVLVNNETRLLVANSNRFHDVYSGAFNPKATAGISVIDIDAALRNESSANLGQIPSGYFPRNFAVSADEKTVLVSNTNSEQIMAIDVSTIP